MPELIPLRCGNCAATIKAKPNDDRVQCSFCDTVSLLRRRTGFFERPAKAAATDRKELAKLPVSTELRSGWWPLKAFAPFIAPVLLLVFFAYLHVALKWSDRSMPILVDVNHDGIADVIGRFERGSWTLGTTVRIAAMDGKTGDLIWQGEPLAQQPSYGVQGHLAVHEGLAVFASYNEGNWEGPTLAWDLESGELKWTGDGIAHRNQEVCGAPGHLIYPLGYRRYASLDLATGRHTIVEGEPECSAVETEWRVPPVTFAFDAREGIDPVGDMDPYVAVRQRGSRGPWALVGTQASGPDAHWVGAVAPGPNAEELPKAPELLWQVRVAKSPGIRWDSLTAAVSDDALFSTYSHTRDEQTFVVAHALADGKERWREEIDYSHVEAIAYATGRVFVAGERLLIVLDASTGEVLLDVGPL